MGVERSKRQAIGGGGCCSSPAPKGRSLPIRAFATRRDGAAAAVVDGSLLFRQSISHDELSWKNNIRD